jgi:aryl-alcohol dehydrogenase-like predicted oxidoreductase
MGSICSDHQQPDFSESYQEDMASEVALTLLGDPGLQMLPFVVGCWAWGDDKGVWGWDHSATNPSYDSYDTQLNEQSILGAFEASLQNGVTMFDTAEAYGTGLSEQLTGRMVAQAQSQGVPAMVATKFMPFKWSNVDVREAMPKAVDESLKRLGVEKIDLYQIHNPGHPSGITAQAHALADVYLSGKARSVGVSNFSVKEL